MKAIYTAKSTSKGGRAGQSESDDGRLKVTLSTPKELGGDSGPGTNPEQLFASGYSACFIGALKHVAMLGKVKLPSEPVVTAEVGIGENPKGEGFAISVAMQIKLDGLPEEQARELITKAHMVCPYSNATRGNVDVQLTLAS